jgi:hypothetical protein
MQSESRTTFVSEDMFINYWQEKVLFCDTCVGQAVSMTEIHDIFERRYDTLTWLVEAFSQTSVFCLFFEWCSSACVYSVICFCCMCLSNSPLQMSVQKAILHMSVQ